jgi:hypothetical protein
MEKENWNELYDQGYSTRHIAKMVGAGQTTVNRHLKSIGTKMRPRGDGGLGGGGTYRRLTKCTKTGQFFKTINEAAVFCDMRNDLLLDMLDGKNPNTTSMKLA